MSDEVIGEMSPIHQLLSKVYTRRTNGIHTVLPRHTSIMTDNGFNIFDKVAAIYVHLFYLRGQ